MLKEIRKIRDRSKRVYLYRLLNCGKLPKHINENNRVCYDPQEMKDYQKTHRKGRPPKIK